MSERTFSIILVRVSPHEPPFTPGRLFVLMLDSFSVESLCHRHTVTKENRAPYLKNLCSALLLFDFFSSNTKTMKFLPQLGPKLGEGAYFQIYVQKSNLSTFLLI